VEAVAVRPSRWQVVALVVALCFLTGVIGWLIGRPGEESFNDVDVGFLTDMETHHGGAISLAFAYLGHEHDSLVGQFAREIVVEQAQEISTMNNYLDRAGGGPADPEVAMQWMGHPVPVARMPGMPTRAEVDALRASQGLDADDRFTRLMIRHHAAGAAMAAYEAEHGENEAVRKLAANMARLQRAELAEMNARRRELGLGAVDTSDLDALATSHAA
jgi:uncharacterized protein (DUF305 family)